MIEGWLISDLLTSVRGRNCFFFSFSRVHVTAWCVCCVSEFDCLQCLRATGRNLAIAARLAQCSLANKAMFFFLVEGGLDLCSWLTDQHVSPPSPECWGAREEDKRIYLIDPSVFFPFPARFPQRECPRTPHLTGRPYLTSRCGPRHARRPLAIGCAMRPASNLWPALISWIRLSFGESWSLGVLHLPVAGGFLRYIYVLIRACAVSSDFSLRVVCIFNCAYPLSCLLYCCLVVCLSQRHTSAFPQRALQQMRRASHLSDPQWRTEKQASYRPVALAARA